MIPSSEWMELAECRGVDTELFYPQRGESSGPALMVCSACPVRAECLNHALATGEKHGIWGGRTERGRRKVRRARAEQREGVA